MHPGAPTSGPGGPNPPAVSSPENTPATPSSTPQNAPTPLPEVWARTFHDHIAQYLTAMVLGLRALREQCHGVEGCDKTIEALESIADEMTRELYRVVDRLRDPDELGDLAGDLNKLSGVWAASGVVKVKTRFSGLDKLRMKARMRDAIVGVVKEAVTNSVRYSGVHSVLIRAHANQHCIRIAVSDKGRGFGTTIVATTPTPPDQGGHGIRGMHEHAVAIGATLRIRSAPDRGTLVLLDVPLVEKK